MGGQGIGHGHRTREKRPTRSRGYGLYGPSPIVSGRVPRVRERYLDMVGVTGSIPVAPTTHSRFLPTCGDAAKMPTNGGLFQCVVRVSRSPEGADGRFRTSVSAAKNPVPGARKGVVPRGSPRSCRCWMGALRLKSLKSEEVGIRAGPDQAAQTAATIRPAHPASWQRRCRAEAALRRRP